MATKQHAKMLRDDLAGISKCAPASINLVPRIEREIAHLEHFLATTHSLGIRAHFRADLRYWRAILAHETAGD